MAIIPILQMLPSDTRWTSFLASSAEAGIFHHPAWSQLMAECYGYRPLIVALPGMDGALAAGIPLMEVNSPIRGRRWVSLPFSDFCSPLYADESVLRDLVEGLIQFAARENIPSLELRWEYPTTPDLQAFSRYVIHEIDLRPGEEKVWKKIHEMHRRNIKIAQENDVKIVLGETQENLADFYQLHLLTRRRQGVPIQPWKFFETMQRLLFDQEHGFLLLAYRNGQCLAGAIFLNWKETLTYKYGASRDDSLKYRPNNLIMWTAIQQGCEQGYRCFDMGRTDLDNNGLRKFKSRWGAAEAPLYYSSTNSTHPTEGRLARYMHFVIQKSPVWVCRVSGELLYKHFG
jgi:hypothetical protein